MRFLNSLLGFVLAFALFFKTVLILLSVDMSFGASDPAFIWIGLGCLVPSLLAIYRLDQHSRKLDLVRRMGLFVFLALLIWLVAQLF